MNPLSTNPKSIFLVHDETEESDRYSGVHDNPVMIEFVGHWQVRGFPISCLNQYTLQPNPDSNGDTDAPPDQLTLDYVSAVVTLEGWRLDLLAEELRFGHVFRVCVVPPPSTTSDLNEPYVIRIWVREFNAPENDETPTPVAQPASN